MAGVGIAGSRCGSTLDHPRAIRSQVDAFSRQDFTQSYSFS